MKQFSFNPDLNLVLLDEMQYIINLCNLLYHSCFKIKNIYFDVSSG